MKQVINAQLRSHEVLSHGASNAGDLETVTYNDGTPMVSYTYDRRGRQSTVTRNGITTTLTYSPREIKCVDHGLNSKWWLR